MRNDRERLLDILEAIGKIESYAEKGQEVFEKDELVQTWMMHYIIIIGEAVSNLSLDLRNKYPEIPWRQIIAM